MFSVSFLLFFVFYVGFTVLDAIDVSNDIFSFCPLLNKSLDSSIIGYKTESIPIIKLEQLYQNVIDLSECLTEYWIQSNNNINVFGNKLQPKKKKITFHLRTWEYLSTK